MSSVAMLGLGAMGQRMAVNLLGTGHELHVWNRTQARCKTLAESGAQVHGSPRSAAQQADIVIAMLRDDVASRAAWLDEHDGALAVMARDTVAIECSTLSLGWCALLTERMASQQVKFLDAPVLGSRPQAEARQLIHLVGGEKDTLLRVRSVLESNADRIHLIGDHGAGMAMKLAVNALLGIQVAALGEIFGFLTDQDIDLSTAATLFGQLPVTSPAAKGAATAIASGNFAPLFPIELVQKDLEYAIDAARSASSLPLTVKAQASFAVASQRGYGAENINAVAKIFNTDFQGK